MVRILQKIDFRLKKNSPSHEQRIINLIAFLLLYKIL